MYNKIDNQMCRKTQDMSSFIERKPTARVGLRSRSPATTFHAITVGGVVVVGGVAHKAEGEAIAELESTKVEGNLAAAIAPESFVRGDFVVEGGGISDASNLRFLPFGAGSRGGDRLYVTVLVTTDRTLTGLEQALLGASK